MNRSLSRRLPFTGYAILLAVSWLLTIACASDAPIDTKPYPVEQQYMATPMPDRIILTMSGDPARSVDVTWRTNVTGAPAFLEWVQSDTLVGDLRKLELEPSHRLPATTEMFHSDLGLCRIHTVHLAGLEPATKYVYRVGDGVNWSEWFQFGTAHDRPAPFSFIYLGDGQNAIRSWWSHVVRQAHQEAPRAAFVLHAGDLVNGANNDAEWGEWFEAGGWLNAMAPVVATPGNHDHPDGSLCRHWRPQFAFPTNGPKGLEETTYWFDYQGVRIVSVNSYERLEEQAVWLDRILSKCPASQWKIVTLHYPLFSAAKGRDNPQLRKILQPVFVRHHVDLVLQGHDHAYARTGLGGPHNVADGVNLNQGGTVYVVSVSGAKMYEANETWNVSRVGTGIQLYQVIHIDGNRLEYESRRATGELYDAFTLTKNEDGHTQIMERIPDRPEIRH
ncbi:MAG: metallophosphoesterase family protein [Pirellulales bacterium]|nr:metallophosphoesterase family protein [Pirellulales bacterium]